MNVSEAAAPSAAYRPLIKWAKTLAFGAIGLFVLYRGHLAQPSQYLGAGRWLYLVVGGLALLAAVLCARDRLSNGAQSVLLSSLISALFLDLVFSQVDFARMWGAFVGLSYVYFIPSTVLLLLSSVIRAYRWKWFFPSDVRSSFWSRLSAMSIGVAANQVLPARAGEFTRAYVFGRRTQMSKTTVFATVVLERVFDGLNVLFFLVVVALLIGVHSPEIQYMGLAGAGFYIGAIALLVAVHFRQTWLEGQVRRWLPGVASQKALGLLRAFADGLSVIRSARQLTAVAALSLLCWLVIAASFWPILSAFNFGAPVPLYTPLLLVAALGLGLMLPAAPAGVGIFQYACVLTLQVVFAPYHGSLAADFAEQAAAFALVVHVAQVTPEVLLGVICFLAEGLSWREVSVSGERA
jgi:uncharacterized protein (TIRG00374 family)